MVDKVSCLLHTDIGVGHLEWRALESGGLKVVGEAGPSAVALVGGA